MGVFAIGSGGSDEPTGVSVSLGQAGSEIPDGWKTIDAGAGIGIAVPPEWGSYEFGGTDVAGRE